MHVISSLNVGGAELMLKRLIEAQQRIGKNRHTVISLNGMGKVGQQLQSLEVEVQTLGMRSFLDIPRVLWQLTRQIRASRPDIVQTWMYHADLVGGLAARLAGNRHVIWGVRCSAIPQRGLSATRVVVFLCSRLSRFLPRVIVCCAESVRGAHVKIGYDRRKMAVIPNGFDLRQFTADLALRQQARGSFGFAEGDLVVGIVGRFDPLKDHRNFILSATTLARKVDRVKFLMVGRGLDSTNAMLQAWLHESEFGHKFVLAGEIGDVPRCLAAMDVFCLSSSNEGFPNVICEAMAMNVPCVVTDAGDAAEIVSDAGIVVAPYDSKALSDALQTMLGKSIAERLKLGKLARLRIEKDYSIEKIATQFDDLYRLISQPSSLENLPTSVTN